MKRRSRAGGEPIKGRRRKAVTPKRPTALKPTPSAADLQEQLDHRARELSEALEQQTATSEVLRIISSSPRDLKPVFAVILENATRLCQANFGALYLCEGDAYRTVAMHNAPPAFVEARTREPLVSMTGTTVLARVARTKRAIQVADMAEDPAYRNNPQNTQLFVRLAGARSAVLVPMLKNEVLIGTIVIFRQEVRSFTDKQIKLVQNFATQAVIAIENARLLNELRQRTTDLSEALEQQTATSEVLQVISRSPGDLEPVFAAILNNAVRICAALNATLWSFENDRFYFLARYSEMPGSVSDPSASDPIQPGPNSGLGRVRSTKQIVHITDYAAEPAYLERDPFAVRVVEELGIRTNLSVPMLQDNELVGAFSIYRTTVKPFSEKQIELIAGFAAQAVIAIENARLLNELRQRTSDLTERTADLTEALDRQTATSEVLQVISNSPGDLEPAFQAMLENATRICEAKFGVVFSFDGNEFHFEAQVGTPPELAEHNRARPWPQPLPGSHLDRLRQTKRVSYTADYAAEGIPAPPVTLGGARSTVDVPMLKDNELVGAFSIYRQEVRPFTEKQIELVKNFAAQAVIAIENARLLNELRQRTTDLTEALEQQTATSEVLQVISSSPGELEPIFAAMLEKAVRICDANFGNIYRWDSETTHLVAAHNTPPAFAEYRRRFPHHQPNPKLGIGRMFATKETLHVTDARAAPAYIEQRDPSAVAAVELGGVRSYMAVPMLKEGELIGGFTLCRQEVRPFTDKQVELVKNFAAQAVIAIENARLLKELRERTSEVEKLNQHLEQRVTNQVDEIERMGRLRRFLPPQVADLIVASGSEKQLESHRREITALFCDLRGFTGFTESADAEDVMALLRDYHAAIGEIIIKYNGTLERYAGDGVMVVFNDPVPVENPALQAVLMALEVRDAIGALTETWRRLGHDIGFGIGIAHGFATLGTIGFEGRFDYAAIGTVSNVASRLCDEAKPGQILISPRVLMKVENAVKVEPVGEFELKGIRRPLAAYNVVGAVS